MCVAVQSRQTTGNQRQKKKEIILFEKSSALDHQSGYIF